MSDPIVISGPQVEVARWLAVRSALKLEIRTGMVHSRGVSLIKIVHQITGIKRASKRDAYADINAHIVKHLGDDFNRPL